MPVSRLSGTARSRIASTSAASACISPSTSRSGAFSRSSAKARRILRADSLNRWRRSSSATAAPPSALCRTGSPPRPPAPSFRQSARRSGSTTICVSHRNSVPCGRIRQPSAIDTRDARPARNDRQQVLHLPPPVGTAAADRRVRRTGMQQHRCSDRAAPGQAMRRFLRRYARVGRPSAGSPTTADRTHRASCAGIEHAHAVSQVEAQPHLAVSCARSPRDGRAGSVARCPHRPASAPRAARARPRPRHRRCGAASAWLPRTPGA